MPIDFPNSPTNGQTHTVGSFTWQYDGEKWIAANGIALDGLTDVTVPSPSSGDFLKWNGTAWVNDAGELGGVVITNPLEYQVLEFNGTNWVNTYASVTTYGRNAESTTLTTGTAVYLFGATGDHATVKRADNTSDATSSKTVGLVGASIAASQNGPIITRGYVDGIDLSVGYTAGDILWLGKNGAFTKTKPTAPDHLVFIGVVVRATNNGIIYVATQNGYELEELHDVKITTPVSDYSIIKYNSSAGVWENVAGQNISTTANPSFAGVTADNVQVGITASGEIDTVSGNLTIDSAGGTVTVDDNLVVSGDLTVNGTTTTLNTETLAVEDNIVVLNSGVTGSPTLDAGIEVERGTSTNVSIRWNETTDKWQFSNDGSTYSDLGSGGGVTVSSSAPTSPTEGNLWFNSNTGATYVYYSSTWVEVGAAPFDALLNKVDAKGDMLVATADNNVERLAVGSNGTFLKANSATTTGLEWASIPTINALDDVGDVSASSPTAGYFLQWNGTAWVPAAVATNILNSSTNSALITMDIGA